MNISWPRQCLGTVSEAEIVRTVATAMVNVALLEHCTMSSSSWTIFFIRDTGRVNGRESWSGLAERTRKSSLAGDFVDGRLGRIFGGHCG
jgi:hypothetical protein